MTIAALLVGLVLLALAIVLGMAIGQGTADKNRDDQIHELRFQLQLAQHQCRRLQQRNDAFSDSIRELALRNTELERTATTYARQGLAVALELQNVTTNHLRQPALAQH